MEQSNGGRLRVGLSILIKGKLYLSKEVIVKLGRIFDCIGLSGFFPKDVHQDANEDRNSN